MYSTQDYIQDSVLKLYRCNKEVCVWFYNSTIDFLSVDVTAGGDVSFPFSPRRTFQMRTFGRTNQRPDGTPPKRGGELEANYHRHGREGAISKRG